MSDPYAKESALNVAVTSIALVLSVLLFAASVYAGMAVLLGVNDKPSILDRVDTIEDRLDALELAK